MASRCEEQGHPEVAAVVCLADQVGGVRDGGSDAAV